MQLLPEKRLAYAILFVMLSGGALLMRYIGFEASNANINVLVCMPFFLIGVFLKRWKNVFSSLHNCYIEIVLFIISIALVILCGNYNGYVWMYLNGFGNNYVLYILGGMAGTCMLYVVSIWLCRQSYHEMAQTLSKGSILIIGLHIIIVRRLTELPNRIWIEDLVIAVLIMLSFVPVVKVVDLLFPMLLGRYKKNY
jgi:hypothetical protein